MPSTSIFKLLYDTIIQTVEIIEDIHLYLYLQRLSVCVSLCQFVDGQTPLSVRLCQFVRLSVC